MYYFITELQTRPDGVVNSTLTTRSSFGSGLSFYYNRAAAAAGSTDFPSVALTLQDQDGNIIKNEQIPTSYVAPNEPTFDEE